MNELQKAQQENQKALIALNRIVSEASESINKAFNDARIASEQLEERLSAMSKPTEREYRAGEWMPGKYQTYWLINGFNDFCTSTETNSIGDRGAQQRCNKYPSRAIAEAAKAHADWWREFDMTDESGWCELYAYQEELNFWDTKGNYGNPKYLSEDSARAAIERLGGEQKVIDMLNKGRVFKFKWGGL